MVKCKLCDREILSLPHYCKLRDKMVKELGGNQMTDKVTAQTVAYKNGIAEGKRQGYKKAHEKFEGLIDEAMEESWCCNNCNMVNETTKFCKNCEDHMANSNDNLNLIELKDSLKEKKQ